MNFFQKLFGVGQRQSPHEQQADHASARESKPTYIQSRAQSPTHAPKLDGVAGVMQEPIQEQLDILRYLCTCDEFDQDKMGEYIAMAERVGMQWSAQEKKQMLNATAYFAPKRQHDGTVLNGYEQLRVEFVEAHAEAISQNLQFIKTLPPEPSTAQFLTYVIDEMNDLVRQRKR